MRVKIGLSFLAVLLTAACTRYEPSIRQVTMLAGETTTISVTAYHYDPGIGSSATGTRVVSSDPSLLQVEQALPSTSVTLVALQPGEVHLEVADTGEYLTTVEIGSCVPVSLRPQMTQVEARVGYPVELRVLTDDPLVVASWYEERNGAWSLIPFGTGNAYVFRPQVSGTFRFLARYSNHCDDVSTTVTVVVSTRARAARH